VDRPTYADIARHAGVSSLPATPPAVYVTELVGRAPGRNHKTSCPFHENRTPSLHVFPTPERGGSIYDLAAAVWGMTPRGREFIQIGERLQERFAAEMSRPRLTYGLERS
jgi:hypothetical protein